MKIIEELPPLKDFDRLKNEVLSLLEKYNYPRQIGLQSLDPNNEEWIIEDGRPITKDTDYKYLHKDLRGTAIEELINSLSAYRSRIMRMPARSCYSVHADVTKRIHIPIVTDPQAWMVWPHHNTCKYLQLGKIYLTDTTKLHSAFNGSAVDRIHLVLCVL